MATIVCGRCGASEDEASASYAEEGLVCAACHLGEVGRDAAQMQEQVDSASRAASGRRRDGERAPGIDLLSSDRKVKAVVGPMTAVHTALEGRGLTFERVSLEKTVTTPLGATASEGFHERWLLPSPPAVQASFTAEGIGKKITKLFKKELQAGDPAFDDAVFVGTDTREATAALLARPDVREQIADLVRRGGWLRAEGVTVEGEVMWRLGDAPAEDDVIARLVKVLLG